MSKDNVIAFKNPETSVTEFTTDILTDLARQGAIQMLAHGIELEVRAFIEQNQSTLDNGHNKLIRNGYLPERTIQTGIGELPVKLPRVCYLEILYIKHQNKFLLMNQQDRSAKH